MPAIRKYSLLMQVEDFFETLNDTPTGRTGIIGLAALGIAGFVALGAQFGTAAATQPRASALAFEENVSVCRGDTRAGHDRYLLACAQFALDYLGSNAESAYRYSRELDAVAQGVSAFRASGEFQRFAETLSREFEAMRQDHGTHYLGLEVGGVVQSMAALAKKHSTGRTGARYESQIFYGGHTPE